MSELDEAQKRAVEAEGTIVIVAPPGSGKTRTLVERIKRLIEKGAAPERILALTFTNKAAGEMRERLAQQKPRTDLSSGSSRSDLGFCTTFHALALQMLRTHGELIGLPLDFGVFAEEKEKIAGSLTFDELLSYALKVLEIADARTHWQERFGYILVDEYQDTDDRQEKMLSILAEPHGNLCVIGDPDQAIYGFRGANVENFLGFNSRYPSAQTIALSMNYRSTATLVCAAAKLFNRDVRAARTEAGEKITLKECLSPAGEARFIVKQIEKLIGGMYHESGAQDSFYQPGDIAVLFRFKAIGKELEKAFAAAGIPYVLVSEQNIDGIEFDTFRVPLMTMHAAKGLEFPVVFMAGLEDGVIPHFGFDYQGVALIQEERRLFYVAITRAKDRLFFSYAKGRKLFGKTYSEPSRFLRDIPSECIFTEEKEKPRVFQKKLF